MESIRTGHLEELNLAGKRIDPVDPGSEGNRAFLMDDWLCQFHVVDGYSVMPDFQVGSVHVDLQIGDLAFRTGELFRQNPPVPQPDQ